MPVLHWAYRVLYFVGLLDGLTDGDIVAILKDRLA
jgi:hypothetical protein